jgi:multimeric flavodoxin WrbA
MVSNPDPQGSPPPGWKIFLSCDLMKSWVMIPIFITGKIIMMRICIIDGDPKKKGFIPGILEIAEVCLKEKNIETDYIKLTEADIHECIGCFNCLKKGKCQLEDDMPEIIKKILDSEGLIIASPVRNGLVTSCYKRFFERITYLLGFSRLLEGKQILAMSSVGMAGGKSVNKKFLGMEEFCPALSGYLFFRVGFPSKLKPDDVKDRIRQGVFQLIKDIENKKTRGLIKNVSAALDRKIMNKFLFQKSPENFSYIIKCWKEKGYIK